jgi:polysaccharide biosynthesis transport protein
MSQGDDLGFEAPDGTAPRTGSGVLTIFWRRKALVSFGLVVGVVVGLLVYAQRPPVYQTTAQVMVIKKQGDARPIAGGDPRLSYVEDYVSSHLVVIRSSLIVERAVKKRNLQSLHSFAGQGDPTGAILATLAAQRDGKDANSGPNNIINLSYRGPVADECPVVLSAIIDSYQSFLNEAYQNVSDAELNTTRMERDRLKQEYEEAQKDHNAFLDQVPSLALKPRDGVNAYLKEVNDLEADLNQLRSKKTKLEGELATIAKLQEKKESNERILALVEPTRESREKISLELFPSVREKLVLAKAEKLRLQEGRGFAAGHDDIKAINAVIALYEKALKDAEELQKQRNPSSPEAIEQAYANPLERHIRQLQFQLDMVTIEMQQKTDRLNAVKKDALEMDTHERKEAQKREKEKRTLEELDKTTKHMHDLERVREAGGFDAQILGRPGTGSKASPNLYQFLLGGALMGLLAGLGLAYLVEAADKSFRTPEEIRRQLGLPVVGHIPLLTPDADAVARAAAGQVGLDPLLVVHYRPRSIEAEAYRAVRTALYFSVDGEGHKVIQVTSANQGDGKSTLASNLAIAIAQSGKKVLLVDADCRRPRQHQILGVEASVGLAQVLIGQVALDAAIVATAVDGLSVLPCGPVPHNPAELLTSPRFPEILADLRQRYDFVLVDTPPLLAVTDPCVVAARVDGVLLTIRMSRKARPNAVRAREILATLGAKILGVVVNGIEREGSAYQAQSYGYANYYTDTATTSAVTTTPPVVESQG